MNMKQKIFNVLVTRGEQRTAAQLAAQFNTTKKTIAARISEIRDEGYAVYSNKRTDSKGRTKMFYRVGKPTRSQIRMARTFQKVLTAVL